MSNLDAILTSLRGYLSPAQAAGVAGNLQVESGFDPAAYNPSEGAIGIAQWEGGRKSALDSFAASRGTADTDLTTQLAFLQSELYGPESGALQQLLQTNDPASAAAAFDQYYERSSGGSRSTRIANAQAIAAGNPTTGGPSGGGFTAAPAGFLTGWVDDLGKLALKVGAGAFAGVLVVMGVKETVKGRSS